jgi:hypothetical protein
MIDIDYLNMWITLEGMLVIKGCGKKEVRIVYPH